ncbi:hypothetical protein JF736_24445, partial [Mycobacterium avium]|nr:hypothetical protein [Mycobacterium avium]
LAADALGVGRFAAAAALLARVEPLLDSENIVPHRISVRRGWVAAELAMARGDGELAVRRAGEAVEAAAAGAAARHQVKSEVVLAAALCSAGDIERARAIADTSLHTTARLRLVPLRWALACLLIDIGSVEFSSRQLHEIREVCAGQVRRAGGTWRSA